MILRGFRTGMVNGDVVCDSKNVEYFLKRIVRQNEVVSAVG